MVLMSFYSSPDEKLETTQRERGNSRLSCAEEAIIKGQTCYFSFSYHLRSAVASEPDGRGLEHVSGFAHLPATETRQSNSLTGCRAAAKRSPEV